MESGTKKDNNKNLLLLKYLISVFSVFHKDTIILQFYLLYFDTILNATFVEFKSLDMHLTVLYNLSFM